MDVAPVAERRTASRFARPFLSAARRCQHPMGGRASQHLLLSTLSVGKPGHTFSSAACPQQRRKQAKRRQKKMQAASAAARRARGATEMIGSRACRASCSEPRSARLAHAFRSMRSSKMEPRERNRGYRTQKCCRARRRSCQKRALEDRQYGSSTSKSAECVCAVIRARGTVSS